MEQIILACVLLTCLSTAQTQKLVFAPKWAPRGAPRAYKENEEHTALTVMDEIIKTNSMQASQVVEGTATLREGDIAVSTGRRAKVCFARSCLWNKSVDGHVYIAYNIASAYSEMDKKIIKKGMENIEKGTCVRFVPRTHQRDFIDIQPKSGCWSYLGSRGGKQTVSLRDPDCLKVGVISHELMHTLGFVHEQSRLDRDNYVTVLWPNIWRDRIRNFEKFKTNTLDLPYDYGSIMHFGMYAYSEDGEPTIVPKNNKNVKLGQATTLSPVDKMKINKLYNCAPGLHTTMQPTMIGLVVLFGFFTYSLAVPVQDSTAEGKVRLKRKFSEELTDLDEANAMDQILAVNSNLKAPRGVSIRDGDIASTYPHSAITCPGNTCLWPKSVDGFVYVPYIISPLYGRELLTSVSRKTKPVNLFVPTDDMDRITIETGMEDIAAGTCVRFVPRTHESNFLDIQPRYGCWSFLGQTGGSQTLSLQTPGCMWSGVAAHEFMHALGFVHEQSRSDRDLHVTIVWKNIMADRIHNFRKHATNNLNSPYDYSSIMHYGRYAFSEDGGPTIIPKPDPYIPIGQRNGPSALDLHKINVLYSCGAYN
ncbi:uncharacterized protein ACB058_008903 [Synchiropus picturatus]